MNTPLLRKIVWAVDTLEPMDFQKNAQFVLGALTRDREAQIFPFHVLGNSIPGSSPASTYAQAYLALSEKRMKELCEKSDLAKMREGKVSMEGDNGVRSAVHVLLKYARSLGADTIVVSTHSKGTIAKFFTGSFAETLLLESEIPVITVNPQSKVRENIRRILFPTSFDERLRPAFHKTLEIAADLDAAVIALYKEPFYPTLEGYPELAAYFEESAKFRQEEAARYLDWAKAKRVIFESFLDKAPGHVAGKISAFAEEFNIDLIAMASQTSQFKGPRVGGVCRQVVRSSTCPVWTFKTEDDVKGEID